VLGPELEHKALLDREFTEDAEVQVEDPGRPQGIPADCAEADLGDRREGGRIIEVRARTNATGLCDFRLDQIRGLRVAWSIERCSGRANREAAALEHGEDAVHLPVAQQPAGRAIGGVLLAAPEEQLIDIPELEHVVLVESGPRPVAVELRGDVPAYSRPAVVVGQVDGG
jgi:hypothetical protein